MNIKSLLIGSAAALTTVSGAYAADAVVAAEPEPMEYVRVCDAYGAGFFYIPGTETCMAISGRVYYQVKAQYHLQSGAVTLPESLADYFAPGSIVPPLSVAQKAALAAPFIGLGYSPAMVGWSKEVQGRLNVDVRNETELGTLRSYIRFQGTWTDGGGDAGVAMDEAYIQLGGLDLGYSESFWVDSHNGGPTNYGGFGPNDMSYGYQQRARIGYRFEGGNGFFGAIALEHDTTVDWMPDVVAKVGMTGAWGGAALLVAYDSAIDNSATTSFPFFDNAYAFINGTSGSSAWNVKGIVSLNVPNMPGDEFKAWGVYSSDDNEYDVGSTWSLAAAYNHQFNEKFGAYLGAQYYGDINYNLAGSPNGWDVIGGISWKPVSGLVVDAQIGYGHRDTSATTVGFDGLNEGRLRITRNF